MVVCTRYHVRPSIIEQPYTCREICKEHAGEIFHQIVKISAVVFPAISCSYYPWPFRWKFAGSPPRRVLSRSVKYLMQYSLGYVGKPIILVTLCETLGYFWVGCWLQIQICQGQYLQKFPDCKNYVALQKFCKTLFWKAGCITWVIQFGNCSYLYGTIRKSKVTLQMFPP